VRLVELTAIHARIPLRRRIRHASHARSSNDTLLIRARLDDGSVGWGEGLPRPYVTGETIDSAWQQFASLHVDRWLGGWMNDLPEVLNRLHEFTRQPFDGGQRPCFGNALRCAVELAVLDAVCRSVGWPMSAVFAASGHSGGRERVQYSAAITSTDPVRTLIAAGMYGRYRFEYCKVKVGTWPLLDPFNVRAIRRLMGQSADIRIDANESWRPANVERRVNALRAARLSAVEQPLRRQDVLELKTIRPKLGIDVVLDESLCDERDAAIAIEHQLCDVFNLRLSKCGGILQSLRLKQMADQAGLQCQLGCQVGETGILSAAGRHFACAVEGLRYLEGSFDRLLVRESLIQEDITFRPGGWAPRLEGPGLGVTVDEQAVRRVTVRESRKNLAAS
jgi:L-Ala-D/L-Glu epimerase